jgi:wobble nucleotide-excising tRNase
MTINELVTQLRTDLTSKKYVLIYAYNGTGKTRLSMAFKDSGRNNEERDTLYFNAFTEDLFHWDNDLDGDTHRVLTLNHNSRFFSGLESLEMESRIRAFLHNYVDFDFTIDYTEWKITFSRDDQEHIKVSRGEENIFIWCFFLAIVQIAIDSEIDAYNWVQYIYIDDPISSLDDNNVIEVASRLAILLKGQDRIKTIISSHHTLFFNVMYNELKRAKSYFLKKEDNEYVLKDTTDTPYFYHVAMLQELKKVAKSGNIYTYHFNILRGVLEKTANFHGFQNFSACIKQDEDDVEGIIHARIINLMSHDGYSVFEPREMGNENKGYFRKVLNDFIEDYPFNPELFPTEPQEES